MQPLVGFNINSCGGVVIAAFQGEVAHVDQELFSKQELQRRVSGDCIIYQITDSCCNVYVVEKYTTRNQTEASEHSSRSTECH